MANTRNTRSGNSSKASKSKNTSTSRQAAKASNRARSPSGGPPPNVSQVALLTYQRVKDCIEAQKKAKKAEDDAIRARNQELLDADDESAEEEGSAFTRKRKRASEAQDISDDEAEIADGLPPVKAAALGRRPDRAVWREEEDEEEEDPANDEETQEQEETHREHEDQEEGLNADLEGIDIDEVDVDMDLASGEGDLPSNLSNEIEVGASARSSQSRSKSRTPRTPGAKTPNANSNNTSKVVEKDFTPRTLRLAILAKSHVRTRTVYDEPFPRNNKIARINFAWKTIKESAVASDDLEVRNAYKRAVKDTSAKSKLMKFTLYGRTGLISSIISKARDKVRAFYGLSGDPESIKRDVEWLLKDSHFVYGGINLKDRTVDQMKPFGCQLIVDIIEAQWFPSTSRSKLDLETTNRIYERRDLPLNVLLLSVTAIEHALKEWSSNGRKACQIVFSEDTAKQSYERHLSHWKFFEMQMKAWPAWFRKTTLGQILANHSNFDINAEENDFAGLDFAALDNLAGYEKECEGAAAGERGGQMEGGNGEQGSTMNEEQHPSVEGHHQRVPREPDASQSAQSTGAYEPID